MKSKEKINKDYDVFRTLRFHWGVFCSIIKTNLGQEGEVCEGTKEESNI